MVGGWGRCDACGYDGILRHTTIIDADPANLAWQLCQKPVKAIFCRAFLIVRRGYGRRLLERFPGVLVKPVLLWCSRAVSYKEHICSRSPRLLFSPAAPAITVPLVMRGHSIPKGSPLLRVV